jgi:hypothetical protein
MQKLVKKNVSGIGFALSASDLLGVLQRFYPKTAALTEKLSASAAETQSVTAADTSVGTVEVSEPQKAEILVDGNFVGNAPSRLPLPAGLHLFVVKTPGHADWIRRVKRTQRQRGFVASSIGIAVYMTTFIAGLQSVC